MHMKIENIRYIEKDKYRIHIVQNHLSEFHNNKNQQYIYIYIICIYLENQGHDRISFTFERGKKAVNGKEQHRKGYNSFGNIFFLKLGRKYTDI